MIVASAVAIAGLYGVIQLFIVFFMYLNDPPAQEAMIKVGIPALVKEALWIGLSFFFYQRFKRHHVKL